MTRIDFRWTGGLMDYFGRTWESLEGYMRGGAEGMRNSWNNSNRWENRHGSGMEATDSYVKYEALNPLMFPTVGVHGPRLGNFDFQSAEEGTPLNYCIGPDCKVTGVVIWMNPVYEI